jgi:16S rRNA (guanine527-N7)-methyltransferase
MLPDPLSGIDVSRETMDKLKAYEALLVDWQSRMNLVSRNTLEQAWDRHFVDSLQILRFIPQNIRKITDIGSGAGFPGLVLAICRPDIEFQMVESTGKKCRFLEAVAVASGARNVVVRCERAEAVVSRETPPDMVTARALASLNELLTMIHPWAKKNKSLTALFPKGAKAAEEMDAARAAGWTFEVESHASVTDDQARVLLVRKIRR